MMGRYMSFQGLERFSVFQAYDVIIGHRAIVDLLGFCGERLAHFPGVSLEGDGALEAE